MVPAELGQLVAQAHGLEHQLFQLGVGARMLLEGCQFSDLRVLFFHVGFVVPFRFGTAANNHRSIRKPVNTL